jgi:hypothetical protein
MYCLVSTYSDQGQFRKVKAVEVEITELRMELLGEENPYSLYSV